MSSFGKVAVLMGGLSAEREVSLRSGAAVLTALQRQNIDAHGVDVGHDIVSVLLDGQFDCAFIALHGRRGEDGVIQGVLETLNIPYTGSGVLGSALSMDKVRSKQVWQTAGLPTPAFAVLNDDSDWSAVVDELGLPLAVKPVHEGSSLGATRVEHLKNLEPAWRNAAEFDATVMAEPWIIGEEYTVGILDGEALPVIRLETPREFYDYEAKYNTDDTRYHCPSGLSAADEQQFQALALSAFTALGATGWGRIDFMLDKNGAPWLLENNTVPGLTDHSLVPMAAQAAGIDFDELILRVLSAAMVSAVTVSDSAEEVGNGC
ncbi:D-alanine--D-alanine ligase [hydrothermal vent metagenome]|uniref:D-alanine--D-alanine ligase n=1 Tax=hydrothermal vent metagenome TaxID=652676 RepID=A0A3B1ACF3_9ZZZZ